MFFPSQKSKGKCLIKLFMFTIIQLACAAVSTKYFYVISLDILWSMWLINAFDKVYMNCIDELPGLFASVAF